MALLAEAEDMELGNYVTIAQGAKLKGVSYFALRQWLARHPEVEVRRVGNVLVVRRDSLNRYEPR